MSQEGCSRQSLHCSPDDTLGTPNISGSLLTSSKDISPPPSSGPSRLCCLRRWLPPKKKERKAENECQMQGETTQTFTVPILSLRWKRLWALCPPPTCSNLTGQLALPGRAATGQQHTDHDLNAPHCRRREIRGPPYTPPFPSNFHFDVSLRRRLDLESWCCFCPSISIKQDPWVVFWYLDI